MVCSKRLQHNKSSSPRSSIFTGKPIRFNIVKPLQDTMDCSAEIADTFAMDYPDLENFFVPAFLQVIRYKVFYI
jgi:hypothetical protein